MNDEEPEIDWICPRPLDVVQFLKPEEKWEVSRRHPYYLIFWQLAQPIVGKATKAEESLQIYARMMLEYINLSDVSIDPSTPFHKLDADKLAAPWVEGAIAPIRLRTLLLTMIRLLSRDTKKAVIDLLQASLNVIDEYDSYHLLREVAEGNHPNFDMYFPDLMVTINPRAPQRAAAKAVEMIISDYRSKHNIIERRRRDEKIAEYLNVWDLREGWNGATYDCERELKLKEIARMLKKSIQTVSNHYASAFKYIVGHDYNAELWAKIIGFPKVAGLLGVNQPRVSLRRPNRKRSIRLVTETSLGSNGPTQRDFLKSAGMNDDHFELIDLVNDISTLISRGKMNEEIIRELELSDTAECREFIEYYRQGGLGPSFRTS